LFISWGGSGDDELYGQRGNDVLYGDSGNDFLFGDLAMVTRAVNSTGTFLALCPPLTTATIYSRLPYIFVHADTSLSIVPFAISVSGKTLGRL
jgi:Ca2+-binding RTX toxin-like protein